MATKKITIKAPTKKETTAASQDLRKGRSDGGRVMAEASKAAKPSPPKKPKPKK